MYFSGNNWRSVHHRIQSDFDGVVDWTLRNNLRLNQDKTKAMIFGSRSRIAKLNNHEQFRMGANYIEFVHSYVYLGVTIDDVMSLVPLIKTMKKRISDKIFMFRKIRSLLTFEAAVLVYKQTILPIIRIYIY